MGDRAVLAVASRQQPGGRAAATAAAWPTADLERRLARALTFADAVVADFGETGYEDAERPALGFGEEKVVAEATMLAYAAAHVEAPAVRARLDALVARLRPLVRSRRALADLALHPERAFKRAVPHVLLTVLGHPDEAFDAFAARRCARVLAHAVDEPPTVLAERRWIAALWGRPLGPSADPAAATALARPFDLEVGTREDPYGLTHLLFYVSDFGRRPPAAARPHAALLGDVEALLVRFLDNDDYDLSGELLMAWPQLAAAWSPAAAFGFRVLADAEDEAGFLPCGNVDPARLARLRGTDRTRYARATSYHTALVMGFLCAVALRPGAPPPAVVHAGTDIVGAAPRGDAAWRSFREATEAGSGRWRAVFDACAPPEKRLLAPVVALFALTQAMRRRDARAAGLLLADIERFGLRPHPLHAAARDWLRALGEAAVLADR